MVNDIDHTSVDVKILASSLRSELKTVHPLSGKSCIYRVPKRLRQTNEKDYTPQIVSIGPFHHGREDLKPMEEMKRRYLKNFLQRTEVSLEDFLKLINEKEAEIRGSYAEFVDFDSHDFVKMILVDAIFIIEVFLRFHFFKTSNAKDHIDPIYDRPWMITDVKHDMWLLENQLPFFILQDLFDLADISLSSEKNEKLTIVDLVHQFCKYYWEFFGIEEDLDEMENPEVLHLVDFLRTFIIPPGLEEEGKPKILTTPSVTELYQAGVKFKPSASSKSLFHISFNNGVLKIPLIRIRPSTEILLKNLLAFEHCHCYDSLISDYVILISYLADTAKDVDLLVQNGIIEHRLGSSEAVSTLFHNFIKGFRLDLDGFYFSSLIENLSKYYSNPMHLWKANLRQDYCKTPWATASVIAGVVLLILTFLQTVSSMIPLFQKHK